MRVFNGRGGQEIVDNFIIGCKGIVPCLDGADRFIKIYKLIQKNNIVSANKEYEKNSSSNSFYYAIHKHVSLLW